jgi:hypothetical protein
MPSTVSIVLDTTGPAGVTASVAGAATAVSARDTTVAVGTSDGGTAGYQVKIWGDVDPAANASIQATEGASAWLTLASPHAIRLSTGDGTKTINVRLRDDVLNESAPAADSVTLDTTLPVPNVTSGPTAARVSKIAGARTSSFTWSADAPIGAYEVRVVPTTGAARDDGTLVGTTNGSTNVAGVPTGAATPVTTTIDGRDLEAASAGDATKLLKVFVQDPTTGIWSSV